MICIEVQLSKIKQIPTSHVFLVNQTLLPLLPFQSVRNDVGDIRGRGSFSGTGPVESMNSASWEWNHSSYYVAGDASKMSITKVVITYMNGTTKTLTGNNIIIN